MEHRLTILKNVCLRFPKCFRLIFSVQRLVVSILCMDQLPLHSSTLTHTRPSSGGRGGVSGSRGGAGIAGEAPWNHSGKIEILKFFKISDSFFFAVAPFCAPTTPYCVQVYLSPSSRDFPGFGEVHRVQSHPGTRAMHKNTPDNIPEECRDTAGAPRGARMKKQKSSFLTPLSQAPDSAPV